MDTNLMKEEGFLPLEPGSHTERILQYFGFTTYVTIFVEGQNEKVSEFCMNHPVDYHHNIQFTNDGVIKIHGQQSNMLDVIWVILDAFLWLWETLSFLHRIFWRYALIVENQTKEDLFVSCAVLHEEEKDWDRAQYTFVPSTRSALFEPFPTDITGNTPLYVLTVRSKEREIYFRGQSFDVGIWKLIIKDDRETEQIARKCDILYYLLAATLAVCFFAIYRSSDFDLDSMVTFICFAVPALISLMISWFLHTKYDIIIQAHHSNQLLANSIKITGRPSCEREVANGSSQCGDSKLPAIVVGYSEPLVDAQVIVTGAGAMGPQTRVDIGGSIVVSLGTICVIESFQFALWATYGVYYHYYIEMSIDGEEWEMVIDKRVTQCRNFQDLYFTQRPVKYIKIVGTYKSTGMDSSFQIISLQ
ncbi:hypothetical protein QR680_014468 [Steinernema hermaphroditum]|uniref:F5/8 type C domain-containing protein n=1 Tax=Steinernema hermaphroditum TaxID=289476 RepID=A0AA39IAL0_9BILA|nr:hypothetical protein QR680_014468 [Steinernema hermaphroditum]